jgi:hypothetical protein
MTRSWVLEKVMKELGHGLSAHPGSMSLSILISKTHLQKISEPSPWYLGVAGKSDALGSSMGVAESRVSGGKEEMFACHSLFRVSMTFGTENLTRIEIVASKG